MLAKQLLESFVSAKQPNLEIAEEQAPEAQPFKQATSPSKSP